MSKAIEVLMHEHRIIEKVLDALKAYGHLARQGQAVDRAAVAEFAEFFIHFADKCHHGKEEDQLFTTMVQHGFPREQGPIAVMLAEHTMGREHVAVLAKIGGGSGPLSEDERRQLGEHADAYHALLRSHIMKEDNILYPMASRMLPEAVMNQLAEDFDTFERETMGEGTHERYHEMAHRLMAGAAQK